MIAALFQVVVSGFASPRARAIPYMITPASRKRVPAIKNGGIDWMAKRIPR